MGNIKNVFCNFITRFKYKRLSKYEKFGLTFAITYLITILFTVLVVLNQFEEIMFKMGSEENLLKFVFTTEEKFSFGYCSNLNAFTYLLAKLFETLIPTTLTFSGTILVLQTTTVKNTSWNVVLFIALLGFTMIGMFFMVSKLETTLRFYMWILLALFIVVFIFSAKLFTLQKKDNSLHKKEESDGKIIG